jgi:two-component system, NarL family, sensor kinase
VRWFYLTVQLYPSLEPVFPKRLELGGVMTDITHVREMEEVNRQLSRRLIHLRDDEQRRISRELHDGLGQLLVALRMRLDGLARETPNPDEAEGRAVRDCMSLSEEAIRELRSMSYLLHPPGLEEAGLTEALREYVRGYSERSGITVRLRVTPERFRLPGAEEIALFRIMQEALTNIHRHAGSKAAEIRLTWQGDRVELRVSDRGKGIPADVLEELQHGKSGVGLGAMHERVRELNGELEISSNGRGTTLCIRIPTTAEVKKAPRPGNAARAAKAGA